MKKLKEFLVGSLGTVGMVIWFIIDFAFLFTPLWFLDIPSFWITLVLTMLLFIPCVGGLTSFVLWILSFIEILSVPIDGWSIFYFAMVAIYFISTVLPVAIYLIMYLLSSLYSLFKRN